MQKHAELNDQSPMPYGAHHTVKMEKVPARYLLWMWNDGLRTALKEDTKRGTVARYINENMTALQKECPDTVVDK